MYLYLWYNPKWHFCQISLLVMIVLYLLKSWWTHHHWAIVILNAWNTAQCSAFFTPLKGCQLSQKEYWVKVPQQCNWALFRKFAQRACQENNSTLRRARSLSLFVDKFAMAKKAPQPDCQNWAKPFLVKQDSKNWDPWPRGKNDRIWLSILQKES